MHVLREKMRLAKGDLLNLARCGLCALTLVSFAAGQPVRAQLLEGNEARLAPSSLSEDSRQELSDLLSGPLSWTSAKLFNNRVPRIPRDVFDRYMMWNEIALDTTAIDHTPLIAGDVRPAFGDQFGPHRAARAMAITHIAMFEAVNAVTRTFRSYAGVQPFTGQNLSLDRAIAQAAHDALLALYPSQTVRIEALLVQDLASIKGTPAQLAAGQTLGAQAAKAILAMRSADGSQYVEQEVGTGPNDFHLTPGVGYWSPDPISQKKIALGSQWPNVKPFVMISGSQFRPPPPPALSSHEYALAYNNVLALGGDPSFGTPTTRTDQQTFIGRWWGYDGTNMLCAPTRLYNMVARAVLLQQGMKNVAELARFLALANTAMADASIAAWDGKYFYQFWRPVTGIRNADAVGNPETKSDPNWYALGAPNTNSSGPNFTPPFPAYPSGHAVFGGALFNVLRSYWPDMTSFTIVSDEYNGLNRDADGHLRPLVPMMFKSFTEAEYDNAESRIYDGVHWDFDATAGIRTGRKVGDFVLKHAFQRIGEDN